MQLKPQRRFSRADLVLFIVPLLLPVAIAVGVRVKEESRGRYLVWSHGVPSWRKSTCCTNGLKQIGMGIALYKQDQR